MVAVLVRALLGTDWTRCKASRWRGPIKYRGAGRGNRSMGKRELLGPIGWLISPSEKAAGIGHTSFHAV